MQEKTTHMIDNMLEHNAKPTGSKGFFNMDFTMPSRKTLWTIAGAVGVIGAGVALEVFRRNHK